MLRFFPYILKTLWGHRARTLLTVSGTAVALFVFSFVVAMQQGLDRIHSQGDRTVVVFQANKFCPATSHLNEDYAEAMRELPGVADVLPIQVFTNNCRASLDTVVFYGVPAKPETRGGVSMPSPLRRFRDFQLVQGNWDAFEGDQYAGIAGQALAARRKLRVGQRFSIGGVTVLIAGIFKSSVPAEENYIYSHLDFLQYRSVSEGKSGAQSGLQGTVTQFEVRVQPGADAGKVCDAIDDHYRRGPTATNTRPIGEFQASSLADLFQLVELTHYLGLACVGLVIVLVTTTSIMAVQDRIKEHGVLQTIGFSGPRIFVLVLVESTLVSVVGGILGVGAALTALALLGLSIGAEAVCVTFEPSFSLLLLGMTLSACIGILAGLIPAWQAARTDIVTALRQP